MFLPTHVTLHFEKDSFHQNNQKLSSSNNHDHQQLSFSQAKMPTINTLSLFFAAAAVATAKVTSQGCYSSAGSLQNQGTYIYQSTGYCVDSCSSSVIATTKGNECYCGDEVPPASDKVADSMCNIACVGYPYDKCKFARSEAFLALVLIL